MNYEILNIGWGGTYEKQEIKYAQHIFAKPNAAIGAHFRIAWLIVGWLVDIDLVLSLNVSADEVVVRWLWVLLLRLQLSVNLRCKSNVWTEKPRRCRRRYVTLFGDICKNRRKQQISWINSMYA